MFPRFDWTGLITLSGLSMYIYQHITNVHAKMDKKTLNSDNEKNSHLIWKDNEWQMSSQINCGAKKVIHNGDPFTQ